MGGREKERRPGGDGVGGLPGARRYRVVAGVGCAGDESATRGIDDQSRRCGAVTAGHEGGVEEPGAVGADLRHVLIETGDTHKSCSTAGAHGVGALECSGGGRNPGLAVDCPRDVNVVVCTVRDRAQPEAADREQDPAAACVEFNEESGIRVGVAADGARRCGERGRGESFQLAAQQGLPARIDRDGVAVGGGPAGNEGCIEQVAVRIELQGKSAGRLTRRRGGRHAGRREVGGVRRPHGKDGAAGPQGDAGDEIGTAAGDRVKRLRFRIAGRELRDEGVAVERPADVQIAGVVRDEGTDGGAGREEPGRIAGLGGQGAAEQNGDDEQSGLPPGQISA